MSPSGSPQGPACCHKGGVAVSTEGRALCSPGPPGNPHAQGSAQFAGRKKGEGREGGRATGQKPLSQAPFPGPDDPRGAPPTLVVLGASALTTRKAPEAPWGRRGSGAGSTCQTSGTASRGTLHARRIRQPQPTQEQPKHPASGPPQPLVGAPRPHPSGLAHSSAPSPSPLGKVPKNCSLHYLLFANSCPRPRSQRGKEPGKGSA